jgi:hypothetical protein
VKRPHGMFSRMQEVKEWTICRDWHPQEWEYNDWRLWRDQPPLKRKKNLLELLAMLA